MGVVSSQAESKVRALNTIAPWKSVDTGEERFRSAGCAPTFGCQAEKQLVKRLRRSRQIGGRWGDTTSARLAEGGLSRKRMWQPCQMPGGEVGQRVPGDGACVKEDLKARGSNLNLKNPEKWLKTPDTMLRSLSVSSEPRRPPAGAGQEEPGASRLTWPRRCCAFPASAPAQCSKRKGPRSCFSCFTI